MVNIDFKGPLPSGTNNKYTLTVVVDFSKFPFALPCSNVETKTVVTKLYELFSIFGMPAYVLSNRGSSFMSTNLTKPFT